MDYIVYGKTGKNEIRYKTCMIRRVRLGETRQQSLYQNKVSMATNKNITKTMQKRFKQSIVQMDENHYSPKNNKAKNKINVNWSLLDYINLLNVNTAKIISLLFVVWFCIFHGIILIFYGVSPACKGIYLIKFHF